MTDHNKAGEARKGLLAAVKGKAKEFFGAVTGNDSLTAEGQLQQTEARARKEANSVEAVADAEAEQAKRDLADAKREAGDERAALNAEVAAEKSAIDSQRAVQKRVTEQKADRDLAQERVEAEADAQRRLRNADVAQKAQSHAAAAEVDDALDEHQKAVRESALARAEADRRRDVAQRLAADADVPEDPRDSG